MSDAIVVENEPITLIGGGDLRPHDLAEALSLAPTLVAADGGADRALALGACPKAVIGDFDSMSQDTRSTLPPHALYEVSEQETTDFAKALSHIDAPLVLGVGFLGARMDHQLAALHVLLQPAFSPCILVGAHELVVHLRGRLELDLPAGEVVSLFPMQPVTGRSLGLEWPIDGLALSPLQRIGTSNRATGPITLEVDGPGLLALLPRSCLRALMQAMRKDTTTRA